MTASKELIDRMEGLSHAGNLEAFKTNLEGLMTDWIEEGFEKEDIIDYLTAFVKATDVRGWSAMPNPMTGAYGSEK